jgi:tripartite-type tricarboxylate transporter receptor subunit TctC
MRQKINLSRALAFIGGCFIVSSVFGQEAWPTRPITMVVPFPPGGVADTVGRPVAEALSRSLGQSVIVENKPGASSIIGTDYVAKSAPDGYTLLITNSAITINPSLFKLPFENK